VVLTELGYDATAIDALFASGAAATELRAASWLQ
jgi:hypothetical protein